MIKFSVLLVLTVVETALCNDSLETSLRAETLDPTTFAESQNGRETAVTAKNGPREVIWTKEGKPEWKGINFGSTTEPASSHLRLGFKDPVDVGTVIVRGGGKLSVLKSAASYPGNLENADDWLAAEQRGSGEPQMESYTTWILPEGTKTRALRFTHDPLATDPNPAGWLGGCSLLPGRLANVAPLAVASASRNSTSAPLINNELSDRTWQTWESVTREQETEAKERDPISPERPEWVQLTWPQSVKLSGLCGLFSGFSEAEVLTFSGPASVHPSEAKPEQWSSVTTISNADPLYPLAFGPNWIPFPKEITTRAIRLRITGTSKNDHPHMKDKPLNGRRVWLAELMAFSPLGKESISSVAPKKSTDLPHPPIAVEFTLQKPGRVTLVIDDSNQKRVRNLISDTSFPAGKQTVWWDGLDDLGRDVEAARHGIYHAPGTLVAPGNYTVRGLVHDKFDLEYEFPVYTAGNPAWNTADKTGAWLANHTPPQAAIYVPADRSPMGQEAIYIGSYVSEGTHGLAWVDLNGKKLGGMNWVGGNWTGAPFLACDLGKDAVKDRAVIVGSVWPEDKGTKPVRLELRINAITKDGAKQVIKETWASDKMEEKGEDISIGELMGIAAHNGKLAVSLGKKQTILMIDLKDGNILEQTPVSDPRGVAFDTAGRLLVLSGNTLKLATGEDLITDHLEDPKHVTVAPDGKIYISDHGKHHQVQCFSKEGKWLKSIGEAGIPAAGPYVATHMNHPAGLTLDSKNRLWVTEQDEQPKRVSVWSAEGVLEKAFYGPSEYGGGGKLDPADKTKFYYKGMEFALDWKTGASELKRIFFRPKPGAFGLPGGPHGINGVPESPVTIAGKHYFSNTFNSSPTNGTPVAFLWIDEAPRQSVRPVAAMGRANDWPLLATKPFHAAWPTGVNPQGDRGREQTLFLWLDGNGNGEPEPNEFRMRKASTGGVMIQPNGTFVISRVDGKCLSFAANGVDERGVPKIDFNQNTVLADGVQPPSSSGGDQAIPHPSGWTLFTLGIQPYHSHSVSGAFEGQARWSYPNLWPGLHASHESPMPDMAGELIGPTRLLGDWIDTPDPKVGPVCFLNGNMGPIYVFTADGLFVTQLFEDSRIGSPWSMPKATRGMKLNGITLHDENFWPSVTRTQDGNVYLVDGGRSSLIHVKGWESLRRLPDQNLTVNKAHIAAALTWQTESEAARQKQMGLPSLDIARLESTPTLAGWKDAVWAPIDQRGTRAFFNSDSKPYDVRAAMAVQGDRLFVLYHTEDAKLLRNSGEQPTALFKSGGCLDLMLETTLGPIRVIMTKVKDQPRASLYQLNAAGTKPADRVPFSSPHRTIYFDRVDDISSELKFSEDGKGTFLCSLPLVRLGIKHPQIRGDVGILRGDGQSTTARVYWANKATGITADVPSEAELQPKLWGKLNFPAAK